MKRPVLIGIAGGSGSGKSTVARRITESFPTVAVTHIEQDAYYKDQSDKAMEERLQTDYDHPDAFDHDLLRDHLERLLRSETIDMPVYDYATHTRAAQTVRVEPKDIILLEGILIFAEPSIRELCDIRIFVDTDADVRIIRRILRDMKERGRSLDAIILQYMSGVRPAHEHFVEPSKKYADIILPEGGHNDVAIDLIRTKIRSILEEA